MRAIGEQARGAVSCAPPTASTAPRFAAASGRFHDPPDERRRPRQADHRAARRRGGDLVVNELPQGEGAPAHALYAGIIAFLSIDEFETMMRGLVFAGRVRRAGDLYYPAGEA